jgi:hypothetical protein
MWNDPIEPAVLTKHPREKGKGQKAEERKAEGQKAEVKTNFKQ